MSKTCPPRELRKPRLGIPDSYSHDDHHSEDKLSWVHVTVGFQNHVTVEDEAGSALKEIQHYLHAKEFTSRLSAIVDAKRRSAIIQDGQKKKVTISKDNFSALHALSGAHNKKNRWMQDLAGTKPLMSLLKSDKIPGFNKKEELFDSLCEYCVPMKRAVWFIKLTALYVVSLSESKVKRKHSSDLSHDLTLELTRYLHSCAYKLYSKSKSVSELLLQLKPADGDLSSSLDSTVADQMDATAADDTGRKSSVSVSTGTAEVAEATKWAYCSRLTDWLYHERLLDRHKLLKWMVEKLESMKSSNESGQYLYLQLVIKYLSDISQCVSLSRPLVHFCLKKLNNLYKLSQRIESSGMSDKQPSANTPASSSKAAVSMKDEGSIKVEKLEELDSVFSPAMEDVGTADPDQRRNASVTMSGTKKLQSVSAVDDVTARSHRSHTNSHKPSLTVEQRLEESSLATTVNFEQKSLLNKQDVSLFSWCEQHKKLVGLLSCVVQTVALSCTTALVHLPLAEPTGKLLVAQEEKDYSLLKNLQFSITSLPVPSGLSADIRKKQQFVSSLLCVEKEARMRSLAAAGGWSSMSAPTTSETAGGTRVMRLLELLDTLDKHSFVSSHWTSTTTTLYDKITNISNTLLSPDVLPMVLCQWAVIDHREGLHRPFVVAHILERHQRHILKGTMFGECGSHGDEDCCPEVDMTSYDINEFPFHDTLVKFLDTRAPLPSNMEKPLTVGDPFFQLVVLFGELIRRQVFCYDWYLSMLISRGDLQAPVISKFPCIKLAKSTGLARSAGNDCPLPAAKKAKFELPVSSLLSHKDTSTSTPGSNILTPQGTQLLTPGFSITPMLGSQMEVFTSAIDSISPTFDLSTSNHGSGNSTRPTQLSHQMMSSDHGGSNNSDVAILQERQRKLQQLVYEDSGRLPLIISPTDATLLPGKPFAGKTEQFGFLPSQSSEVSSLSEDPHFTIINVETEKHSLYAAHFPIPASYLDRCDFNERMTVLCGSGNTRKKVTCFLGTLSTNVEQYFNSLSNSSSHLPVKHSQPDLMKQFAILPVFHQRVITATCESLLRRSLQDASSSDGTALSHYPNFSQFSFLCDLMETSGDVTSIIELVVDILACGSEEEKESFGVNPQPSPLPNDLCVPIVCLVHKYFSSLLISQHYATVVFENLCRVLYGLREPTASMVGSQRAVLYFLKQLYSSCRYLHKPFHSVMGEMQSLFSNILLESYPPAQPESGSWSSRSSGVMLANLANPSYRHVQHLCNMLRSNPQHNLTFVCEAVYNACHTATLDGLCDLVRVCGDVLCVLPELCNQLLAAIKAVCIVTSRKACFQQLVERVNVTDVRVHCKLIQYITLLLAHNCILMDDFIKHVLQRILYHAKNSLANAGADPSLELSLKFANNVIMVLFIDQGSPTVDHHHVEELILPSYVCHFLYASRRKLSFVTTFEILKDLYKLTKATGGKSSMMGNKTGVQLGHSQAMSATTGFSARLVSEIEITVSCLGSQQWLREKCLMNNDQVLGFADRGFTQYNARYLLHLLCPLPNTAQQEIGEAPSVSIEDILRNLDQWTLRSSLLHIESIINHTPSQSRSALLENIAINVIELFEESCMNNWVGPMEATVEQGDGAYSPPIWLITPLVSKLHAVLGKVLKNAGNVLGRGQWWNPEKMLQEKRRSTRANSGAAQLRCSLQWQQPFLELVLVCLKSQKATHEDLLGPLKDQLLTFLAAHEKEGSPADEQARITLYAAIKLRLSLLGSVLSSVCTNEAACLEWIMLLMRLVCSGVIDRQPENSEVFTHALDMLFSVLNALNGDLLNTSASFLSEDVKRSQIVKKLLNEITNAKSSCVDEIKQLFSVSLKKFEVVTVDYPAWVSQQQVLVAQDKKKGLKINDVKEISPWELIEGVKTSGALSLTLYGGARVERKPLKYEEQFHLVQVHSHKRQLPTHNFVYIADQKDLPSANGPDVVDGTSRQEGELGGAQIINPSSEPNVGKDLMKKAQKNATLSQFRGDQMMQQQARMAQQISHQPMGASGGLPPSHLANTAATVVGPAGANGAFGRQHPSQPLHQQQQPFNPHQGMMNPGGGGGYAASMQKPSAFPPPYQQQRQNEMMAWNNSGQMGGAGGAYDSRRQQLKAIQDAAIQEANQRRMIGTVQQGRGMYGPTAGGQQMTNRGALQSAAGMIRNRNMQDFLNQFPADQREAVYQQYFLKKVRQQHQQLQAMQQQQQQQPHPSGIPMGGAVRANFMRQSAASYPAGQMAAMQRQRPGMIQAGFSGLQQQQQQARQQQLFQIRQQQQQHFAQQQQFGGGAGYNQF